MTLLQKWLAGWFCAKFLWIFTRIVYVFTAIRNELLIKNRRRYLLTFFDLLQAFCVRPIVKRLIMFANERLKFEKWTGWFLLVLWLVILIALYLNDIHTCIETCIYLWRRTNPSYEKWLAYCSSQFGQKYGTVCITLCLITQHRTIWKHIWWNRFWLKLA